MALGHLQKNTDHGSGTLGNEGAQFGAGAQENPILPEFPCSRTNAESPESTEGALVQPLKSDLKRGRCGLMPFCLVPGRKTDNGLFGEENVPGSSISPSSSVWPGREGWGCARSQKKQGWGVFLVSDENLSLTPI